MAAAAVMPASSPVTGLKGASLSIGGRKISWDAILIAGAGLLGVVLLYKAGQPGGGLVAPATAGLPADTTGGSTGSVPSFNPVISGLSTDTSAMPSTTPYYSGPIWNPTSPQPAPTPAATTGGAPPSQAAAVQSWFGSLFGPLIPGTPSPGPAGSPYAAAPAQAAGPSIFANLGAAAQALAAAAPAQAGGSSAPVYTPPTPVAQTSPSLVAVLGASAPGFRF